MQHNMMVQTKTMYQYVPTTDIRTDIHPFPHLHVLKKHDSTNRTHHPLTDVSQETR
jgi:hypothetical protein